MQSACSASSAARTGLRLPRLPCTTAARPPTRVCPSVCLSSREAASPRVHSLMGSAGGDKNKAMRGAEPAGSPRLLPAAGARPSRAVPAPLPSRRAGGTQGWAMARALQGTLPRQDGQRRGPGKHGHQTAISAREKSTQRASIADGNGKLLLFTWL